MGLPEPDELVQLKSQQTLHNNGDKVEEWTLDVWAISDPHARRRARQWARVNSPTIKNILTPEVKNTEQSTLEKFITNRFDAEFREVSIVVVRSF